MAPGRLTFRFTSPLVRLAHFHALPVPDKITMAWKNAGIRRLIGTINGHPIKRALMGHADGGSFLIVSRAVIKTAGLGSHIEAKLEFRPDPAPHQLDMPEELRLALDQDNAARERWTGFTLGRQRSLASFITSAKNEATRIRRAVELATRIRTHTLYGDLQRRAAPRRPTRPD